MSDDMDCKCSVCQNSLGTAEAIYVTRIAQEVPLRLGENGPIIGDAKVEKNEEGNYIVKGEITDGVPQQFRGILGRTLIGDLYDGDDW